MNRNLFKIFILFVFILSLIGCGEEDTTTQNETSVSSQETTISTTDTTEGTTTEVTTTEEISDLTEELYHIYNLATNTGAINSSFEDWLSSTTVPDDDQGEVLYQIDNGYLQWKYSGNMNWNNLIEISSLTDVEGVEIENIQINSDSELEIVYTDETIVNLGEITINFTVDFIGFNQVLIESQSITYGSNAEAPQAPDVEGYTFREWDIDFTSINTNITVTAVYDIKENTISFNSNDGTTVSSIVQDYATAITEPENPTKEGYTFNGWYSDIELTNDFTFTTMPAEDITLYASWDINQYTISFISNGGTSVTDIIQDYNTDISIPNEPTKLGYTFVGWYSDIELTNDFTFTTMPAEDITLYASWDINQYTISFISNGGSSVTSIIQDYNTNISAPNEPTKLGYTFVGWYSDIELISEFTFTTMPLNGLTLYAKWSPNLYTVNFVINDGESDDVIVQAYADSEGLYTPNEREGFTFSNWCLDSELTIDYEGNKFPLMNITLYAKWIVNQYNVNYAMASDDFDASTEILLMPSETIIQVSLGESHSALITSLGRVFTWGLNDSGQLGNGTTLSSSSPVDITEQFDLNDNELIIQIALGYKHSLALSSEGRVFAWGDNDYGQLGNDRLIDFYSPVEITAYFGFLANESISEIFASNSFSAALSTENRLFTWGNNEFGQLGDGTIGRYAYKDTPTDITSIFSFAIDEVIEEVSLGSVHAGVITSQGRVFMWGSNYAGALGDGTTTHSEFPIDITEQFSLSSGETVSKISLGYHHSLAVTTAGSVFTWGSNSVGQLGDGTWGDDYNETSPQDITYRFSLASTDMIIGVEAANNCSSAISLNNEVFAWGYNSTGQLGIGSTQSKTSPINITNYISSTSAIIDFEFGFEHASAITSSGEVYIWGKNLYGQLGIGTEGLYEYSLSPTLLPYKTSSYYYSTANDYNSDISDYIPERVGYTFDGWYIDAELITLFEAATMPANDITLYGRWILNTYVISYTVTDGEGLDNPISYSVESPLITLEEPTKVGYMFSWYDNPDYNGEPITEILSGSTGNIDLYGEWKIISYTITYNLSEGTNGENPSTYNVDDETITLAAASKTGYTFSGWYETDDFSGDQVTEIVQGTVGDIDLYAKWTINTYSITYHLDSGLNGSNPSSYTIVTPTIILANPTKEGYTFEGWYQTSDFSGEQATEITLGTTEDIDLYAKWIINEYTVQYAIITDDYDPISDILLLPGETIIDVSLGEYHSSALTSLGRVFTWGFNSSGQLGDGTTISSYTPINITSQFNLNEDETIDYITLGLYHSLVITSEGRVFTWGSNNFGILGDGTNTNSSTPIDITNNFNLSQGETIVEASLGYYHSSVLTSAGRLLKWGRNDYGQLGDSNLDYSYLPLDITNQISLNTNETIVQVSLGNYHSAVVTSEGRIFTWGGDNYYGELGDSTNTSRFTPLDITNQFSLNVGETIVEVSLGGWHSSAKTSEGRMFTWGRNSKGQLGNATTTNSNIPVDITSQFGLITGETIEGISLGYVTSSVLTSKGRFFIWGDNTYGQIGDGNKGYDQYLMTPLDLTIEFNLDSGETIVNLSLSRYNSSVVTSAGKIFVWGYNSRGQLGDGTQIEQITPSEVLFYSPTLDNTIEYNYGETLDYTPVLVGYTFDGWYTDSELTNSVSFSVMPAQDYILYAQWIEN